MLNDLLYILLGCWFDIIATRWLCSWVSRKTQSLLGCPGSLVRPLRGPILGVSQGLQPIREILRDAAAAATAAAGAWMSLVPYVPSPKQLLKLQ